jgi:hypothetical protein
MISGTADDVWQLRALAALELGDAPLVIREAFVVGGTLIERDLDRATEHHELLCEIAKRGLEDLEAAVRVRDDLGESRIHVSSERAVILVERAVVLPETADVIADFLQDLHGPVGHETQRSTQV